MQISQVSMMPVKALRLNKRNARTHSKKQVGEIANSMLQFGFTNPVLVNEKNSVIAGHGRLLAAAELGLKEVPVIVISGLDETQQRILAIADNKIADNAGFDRKILAAELGELAPLLAEINLDISITGFDPAEIDALSVDFSDPEHDPADEILSVDGISAVSTIGDVWLLD